LLEEIKEGITGFARIIYYTNSSFSAIIEDTNLSKNSSKLVNMNPLNLCLQRVEEGQFSKGKKDGYCRIISAQDGKAQVGFFQEDKPMGKYCVYAADGTFDQPEGLYEGYGECKSKI
jgi:hypothetical protein